MSATAARLLARQGRRSEACDEDEWALRTLHARYGGALYGYARRALGDDGAAEEVVQDVLLRAWQHGHRLERPDDLGPWLYTITRNLVIDGHRRRRSRPRIALDASEREVEDAAQSGCTNEISRLLARGELVEALRRLPPGQRDVIIAVFYGGTTIAKTAISLGIAEGTVKSRLHYGLRALKQTLDEMGAT